MMMIIQEMMKQEEERKVKMDVMYHEEESDDAMEEVCCGHTQDGSVNFRGKPALKNKSGRWFAGIIILGTLSQSIYLICHVTFFERD